MSLVEFLRARLDELERRTHGSGRVAWLTYRDADGGMNYTTVASATIEDPDQTHWCVDGREATGWATANVIYDEREVLAEVDAKRRIVDEWLRGDSDEMRATAYVVRLLALPYADHPDYGQGWQTGRSAA